MDNPTPKHTTMDHSTMSHAGMDHDDHAVHSEGQHAGHSTAMFKNRFWLTLVLSIPVVFFSPMVGHLLGYSVPVFVGSTWIPALLGTFIFFYGGQPFLKGGWQEIKSRQPGMMLLISMAITVAFIASWATTLGLAASIWTSGGNWPCSWPSCCWATGSKCGHWVRPEEPLMPSPRSCQMKPSGLPQAVLRPSILPN